MKTFIQKINHTPLAFHLFFLTLFFLPFQERYHKLIKRLSHWAFREQFFPATFFDRMLDFYISDFLLIGLFILSMVALKNRWKDFWENSSQKYLIAFLWIALLSILFSPSSSQFWPYWRWLQLAIPILGCLAMQTQIDVKKALPIGFWILLITSLLQSIIVVDQYILQESIGLKKLGELTFNQQNAAARFLMENKTRWIFDHYFHTYSPSARIIRPLGTFPHPNILGGFIGMTLFAAFYLFLEAKKRGIRILIGLCIPIQVFTLCLSYSRASIFGVLGGSLFYFFYLLYTGKTRKKLLLQLSISFLLGGILSGCILHEQFAKRGGISNYNKGAKNSDIARLHFQNIALKMIRERPFIGQGWNQCEIELAKFVTGEERFYLQKVHNIYLLILVETGIFGFAAFLGFLVSLLYGVWKKEIDLLTTTLLLIFVFFLWIGCVDHYWITMHHGRLMFFIIAGLLSASSIEKRVPLRLQNPVH